MGECNETLSLLARTGFACLVGMEVIVGLLATLTNVCLLVSLWKTGLFHNNLRILLTHLSLVAIWFSMATSVKGMYIFGKWRKPCHFVTTLYECKLIEVIQMLPLLALMCSLVPIGLERMYATLRYRTYERSRTLVISIGLITLTWLITVATQFHSIVSISQNSTVSFCVGLVAMTKWAAIWMLVLGISQEFVAVAFSLATYFINKRLYVNLPINRACEQTLTGRFQLAENIQVSEIMLPTAFMHAAFMLPASGLCVLVVWGLDVDFIHQVELVHAYYLSALGYAFLHPIVCFGRNVALRRSILGLLSCSKTEVRADPKGISQKRRYTHDYQLPGITSESERHFDILMRTWEGTIK